MTTTPAAHPAKDLRGKECEVLDGNPDSPTHGQWLKARFVSVDLIGQEPIVQVDGCMPWFATWGSVRGITKSEAFAPGQPGYVTRQPYPQGLTVMPEVGAEFLLLEATGVSRDRYEDGNHHQRQLLGCYVDAGLCYPATPEGEAHAKLAWQARFGGERG